MSHYFSSHLTLSHLSAKFIGTAFCQNPNNHTFFLSNIFSVIVETVGRKLTGKASNERLTNKTTTEKIHKLLRKHFSNT